MVLIITFITMKNTIKYKFYFKNDYKMVYNNCIDTIVIENIKYCQACMHIHCTYIITAQYFIHDLWVVLCQASIQNQKQRELNSMSSRWFFWLSVPFNAFLERYITLHFDIAWYPLNRPRRFALHNSTPIHSDTNSNCMGRFSHAVLTARKLLTGIFPPLCEAK